MQKLKKLQGFENYYRIKLGDYRIGIEIEKSPENTGEEIVTFIRFIHRKDIYRYFP
ncbi:MAG: type II toxin-antitoxin system RelE/ParE family toxin [Bacteroidetes bacterium]|nr:type II toxin-antitoxin system RelE/ParE family toxin [Bacteroidota bacterium]